MRTDRPQGYSALSCRSRVEILHLVQQHPASTVAALAAATELHPNTVREHLQRLIDGGYVVAHTEERTVRGRPRTLFSAIDGEAEASSPIARRKARDAATRGDLMRKVMPWTDTIDPALGEAAVHQVDAIVDHLEESGFDPIVDESALSIDLRACPHAPPELEHREALCSAHRGMMHGVLAEAGGPLTARIEECASSHGCIIQLRVAS